MALKAATTAAFIRLSSKCAKHDVYRVSALRLLSSVRIIELHILYNVKKIILGNSTLLHVNANDVHDTGTTQRGNSSKVIVPTELP